MLLTIIFNIKKPAMNSMFIHYSVHCLAFYPIHLLQVFILCNVIGHFTSIIVNTRCKYFDPCYARATVARARFLAAAFSDGSYLALVNGAYLRHVTFCIVRGPPLFIVSPISESGSRAAAT